MIEPNFYKFNQKRVVDYKQSDRRKLKSMGNKFSYEQVIDNAALSISDGHEFRHADEHFRDVLRSLKPNQKGMGWPYVPVVKKIRAAQSVTVKRMLRENVSELQAKIKPSIVLQDINEANRPYFIMSLDG